MKLNLLFKLRNNFQRNVILPGTFIPLNFEYKLLICITYNNNIPLVRDTHVLYSAKVTEEIHQTMKVSGLGLQ